MPETNIANATASDLTNATENYSVPAQETDGVIASTKTTWQNTEWSRYLGYYKTIPELASSINTKASWVIGKGFTADERTELMLMNIKGWGKDTFNTIIENMVRVKHIGGDSYCHIITHNKKTILKGGQLVNLKPLDPGTMVHVVGANGMLEGFEQVSKVKGKANKKFKPEEIFYLGRNRVADEIHGCSIIPAVENLILARNEAITDYRTMLHRNVNPRWKISLDTDNPAKIAAFKAKYDAANALGENMYIPKGTVEVEVMGVAPNATLNPLPWIDAIGQYFFQAVMTPDIVMGGGSQSLTEGSSKIKYLAYQQVIEKEQLDVEEGCLNQLNVEINLEFPASLVNEMLSQKQKGEEQAAEGAEVNAPEIEKDSAAEPNDTTAELEGNK